MESFMQNQWFINISGGIISGIIVFLVTKWIIQRKDNSKYLNQINAANTEIIRILKQYVVEKGLPEKEIIDAIILSIARKVNVKSDELYSIRVICEELIREVVENVYVSSDKKQEYSRNLVKYLNDLNAPQGNALLVSDIEKEIKNKNVIAKIDYKRRLAFILSATISLFASFISFTLINSDSLSFLQKFESDIQPILIVIYVSLIAVFMSIILLYFPRLIDKLKKEINKH